MSVLEPKGSGKRQAIDDRSQFDTIVLIGRQAYQLLSDLGSFTLKKVRSCVTLNLNVSFKYYRPLALEFFLA